MGPSRPLFRPDVAPAALVASGLAFSRTAFFSPRPGTPTRTVTARLAPPQETPVAAVSAGVATAAADTPTPMGTARPPAPDLAYATKRLVAKDGAGLSSPTGLVVAPLPVVTVATPPPGLAPFLWRTLGPSKGPHH